MEKQSTNQYDRQSSGEMAEKKPETTDQVASQKPEVSEPVKARETEKFLYFFPDQQISERRAREILEQGSEQERAWVISHLLRYAQWDEIWSYVSRDEVRALFSQLDLPVKLESAWARLLEVTATASR